MPFSDSKLTRSYSQEDIQQILHLAISRQDYDGEFTRDQLLEIADELEISPENLLAAEREWQAQQGEIQKRQAFNLYRRGKFKKSLGNFAIVNSFLVLLNFVNAGELSWSLYILLFWGFGLSLNAWNTYQSSGEEYERSFQQWYRQYRMRETISGIFDKFLKAW
jgi:2TM domain